MTKVTTLEISVLSNIVALGTTNVVTKEITAVKPTQINAVILNLKGKCLVSRNGETVSLTDEGLAVYNEIFPTEDKLEDLRQASNEELNRSRPMDSAELDMVNALIEIRNLAKKLSARLDAVAAEEMKEDSEEETVAKEFAKLDSEVIICC